MATYLQPPGETIESAGLKTVFARDLWSFLKRDLNQFAKAIDVRRGVDGAETIVFDVEVEVSQLRVHDIRPRERIAATFTTDRVPGVFALRADFPFVPHVNPTEEEFPRSLCVYDGSFDEISLRWTPSAFVERVRWWLSESAKGTLHRDDQPLEPILLDGFSPLVLPADLLSKLKDGTPQRLYVNARPDYRLFRASWDSGAAGGGVGFIATVFVSPPHVHGVIRRRPRTIVAVADVLREAGLDFIKMLRDCVNGIDRSQSTLAAHLIVIVILPKQRKAEGEIEGHEIWAFMIGKPVSVLGEALGVWQMQGGIAGHILGGTPDLGALTAIDVDILNPTFELSRPGAALLNATEPSDARLTAIGMGALGSQVADNLVRSGFGIWTAVDPDYLLPHNVARHEMTSVEVGASKVEGMQVRLNAIFSEKAMPTAIEADVLHPGDKAQAIRTALDTCEVILDFSASLAVARHLASDPSKARRCSVFLNPSGSDLVILCEDKDRVTRLDCLEFQYYRELVNKPALAEHLRADVGKVRYARSCRDLSSRVPQHCVALHSGIAAGMLQNILRADDAFIGIWKSDKSLTVELFQVDPLPVEEFSANGWKVVTDSHLLQTIAQLRKAKSTKETGGVLIGSFDYRNRTIYLADTIPSPPDSEEWPTLYIRGCHGLQKRTDEIVSKSDGQMQYLGEWHSHPDRYSTKPSDDDRKVFAWLSEHAAVDGNPSLMLIAGEKDFRFFVDSMDCSVCLKSHRDSVKRRKGQHLV